MNGHAGDATNEATATFLALGPGDQPEHTTVLNFVDRKVTAILVRPPASLKVETRKIGGVFTPNAIEFRVTARADNCDDPRTLVSVFTDPGPDLLSAGPEQAEKVLDACLHTNRECSDCGKRFELRKG